MIFSSYTNFMKKYISVLVLSFLLFSFNAYAENNNFSEHIKTLEEKCSENDYLSCFYAGQVFEDTDFILLAINSYEKACNNLIYESCVNLGNIYIKDYSKSIRKKSIKLYTTACDNNIAKGCSALGSLYYQKNNNTLRHSYRKARKLYEKACSLLDGAACYNAGLMYEEGKGSKKNIDKAKTFYDRACYFKSEKGCQKYKSLSKDK